MLYFKLPGSEIVKLSISIILGSRRIGLFCSSNLENDKFLTKKNSHIYNFLLDYIVFFKFVKTCLNLVKSKKN